MRKLFSWLSWQKVVFGLLLGIVIYSSRLDGSEWLIGWDSVMPELDWKLNFARLITGSWQEYQGLGLPGGMAHVADLSRVIILWVIDFVTPTQYIRWIWHMGMLVLGSLGIWHLGKKAWKWSETACLVASVFYVLNLATVQYFFVPYESFSSFYGFLPWLLSTFIAYLDSGNRKDLRKLALVGVLATSAFYVQTLFVVYGMILACLSLPYIRHWRRIVLAILAILAVNSFWLLPVLYGTWVGGSLIGQSKINSIGSPETALYNEGFGHWIDVAHLRGYWLEWVEWMGEGHWGRMMQSWWDWGNNPLVGWSGLGLFVTSFTGLLLGIKSKKRNWGWLLLLLIGFVMLGSFHKPFGFVYSWFVNNIPLFGEMFRAVFTKWSVAFALVLSVGLGTIIERAKIGWLRAFMSTLIITGCLVVSWPVFGDGIIFDRMKMEIPNEYQKLYAFAKNMDKGRIAYLPSQDMWSWKYTSWGYRGSGFLWYGIEQPILDRAFDVWSPYNETFYNQLSTALYGTSVEQFAEILSQYDVTYVLLDESIIAPGQDPNVLRVDAVKKYASDLGWKEVFHESFLTVWEITPPSKTGYVEAVSEYVNVEAETTYTRKDVAYDSNRAYVVGGKEPIIYPFTSLLREEVAGVGYGEGVITLRSDLVGTSPTKSNLLIPRWNGGEGIELMYDARLDSGKLSLTWEPIYHVNGQDGPKLHDQIYDVDEDGVWVQIGQSEPVWIEQGNEVKAAARLTVGEETNIRIFSGKGTQQAISDLWIGRNVQENCGVNTSCMSIPLTPPKTDSLVQVVQKYRETRPTVCIDREGEPYTCEDIATTSPNPVITTIFARTKEQNWLDVSMTGNGKSLIDNLESPIVISFPILTQAVIERDEWETFEQEQKFALQGETLKVEVATEPHTYDMATLGAREITNCDVLRRGSVEKSQPVRSDLVGTSPTRSDLGSQMVTYIANERGAVCDYVAMKNLDTRASYLMRLRGEDVAGRSLKFFLYNQATGRNDLEYLTKPQVSKLFDQTFSILPWGYASSYYTLNVETRSFGQYTENKMEPVEVRYFPLEQLAGARITPTMPDFVGEKDLSVVGVKKTGTWLYRVDVDGNGLLKLSQGHDEGWIAVGMSGNGGIDLSHVKVNGWANGWVVPERTEEIIIFYWPQLLEYVGFALLGITIVWVARRA